MNNRPRWIIAILMCHLHLSVSCFADDLSSVDASLLKQIQSAGGQINRAVDGEIVFMGFYEPKGEDHRFSYLKRIKSLQNLVMAYTNSSDWIDSISALPKLEILTTYRANITDQSLKILETVQSLKHFELDVSPISDEGVKSIVKLKNLEFLVLRHVPVTDACLPSIARMPRLKHLRLIATKVTPEGLLALRDSSVEELLFYHDDIYWTDLLPYLVKLKNLKILNASEKSDH